MPVEIVFNYDSDHRSWIFNNETKHIYERGNEMPRLIVRSRNNTGADIEVAGGVLHLPCFMENSDHLLHAMEFKLKDKTVFIRTF